MIFREGKANVARGLGGLGVSLALGCNAVNPAFDAAAEGTAGSGSGGATSSVVPTTTSGTSATESIGMATIGGTDTGFASSQGRDTGLEGTESTGRGDTDTTNGVCGGNIPPSYLPCPACPAADTCLDTVASGAVAFGLGVCSTDCTEDCQCENAVAPGVARCDPKRGCVLDCAAHEDCPGGMLCEPTDSFCTWSEAYGPCDASCEGICFTPPDTGGEPSPHESCAHHNCAPTGVPDNALCPPAPPGSLAIPVCFNFAPGMVPPVCLLNCGPEGACPAGMECVSSYCVHPL